MDFFSHLFDTSDFPPRWKCGNWSEGHGWLHILSDLGVWSAYFTIPLVLAYFVKRRRDLPLRSVLALFAAFILLCGTTHLMEAIIFWWPAYRLAGLLKLLTALVSWATVIALIPHVPYVLTMRTPEELEHEIAGRKRAEEKLQQLNGELEIRIAERTEALQSTAITLRETLKRANQAMRAKDEFLATVSHELRTPLNAMQGWAQLMKDDKLDKAQTKHAVEVIVRNIRAQTQLIEDLLDVSRIMAGKLQLNVRNLNLEQVIVNAVDSLRAAADAKGVQIKLELQPICMPVDPDRLQQVLWNLLSNALKFTEKKFGVITVRLAQIESHVQISVSDEGKGIHPEFLPHLFEQFSQEDSTSTRKYGGLGLGLSISKHLVEAHGGKISAASTGEGLGTEFTIILPIPALVNASRCAVRGEDSIAAETRLVGTRVLVVDDVVDARELLAMVIANYGGIVATASSASEALATLEGFKPDLVISDIGMPETDGYELIRTIRALDNTALKNVPAIALTAYASADEKQRALDAGYQAHAPKPFDADRLMALIANLAKSRR